jgi:hypothetical protein
VTVLTALAILMRVALTFQPEEFWYDETFSYILARLPVADLIRATAGDVHPPLHYLLLKYWLLATDWLPVSFEARGRALSLLFSLAALGLYWLLLRRLRLARAHRRAAWLVACFMPSLIYFSAEMRMYALLELEILGALLFFLGGGYVYDARRTRSQIINFAVIARYLRRLRASNHTTQSITGASGQRLSVLPWNALDVSRFAGKIQFSDSGIISGLGAGICLGLAALTHNAGLIYAVVLAGVVVLARKQRAIVPVSVAALTAFIMWSPWALVLIDQMADTGESYWLWMPSCGTVAYMLFKSVIYIQEVESGLDALLMLPVAGLTTWGLWAELRSRRFALAMLLPCTISALLGGSYALGHGLVLHRILLPAMLIVGPLAWGRLLIRRDVGRVLSAIVIVLFAYANGSYWVDGRTGIDYKLWTEELPLQDGDIVYASNFSSVPLLIYTDLPIYIAPEAVSGNRASGLSRETTEIVGIGVAHLEDIADWQRAWFMYFQIPWTTPEELRYLEHVTQAFPGQLERDGWGNEYYTGELWLLHNPALAGR